jgi:hypothetical protein
MCAGHDIPILALGVPCNAFSRAPFAPTDEIQSFREHQTRKIRAWLCVECMARLVREPTYEVPAMSSNPPAPLSPRLAMDGFLPDDLLTSLLESGHATRSDGVLHTSDGRTYVLEDGVRVIGCHDRANDPYGFTGMVESIGALVRRGFVVSSERIALNRIAYDVELGVIAHPLVLGEDTGVTRRAG